MRERTQEEKFKIRLRQLEEAKKRLGANDPALYDINDEREKIEQKLQILSNNASANGDEDIRTQARNEPFGQDLGPEKEDDDEKQQAARQVIQSEPAKPNVPGNGPQAKASATPPTPPVSPKEAATPEKPPGGWARNTINRFRGAGKAKTPVGGGTGGAATAEGEGAASAAAKTGQAAAKTGQMAAKAGKAIASGFVKLWQAIVAGGPVVWIIVGVGIILIIILFIVGLSYIGTIGKNVGASGGTALQQVNAKTDAGMLNSFAKQTGVIGASSEAAKRTSSEISTLMATATEDPAVKDNAELKNAAKVATDAAATLAATPTTANATALTTAVINFYNLLEGEVPVWISTPASGSTRMPVATITAETKFNTGLHGFSFLNTAQTDNHNVYIRSEDDKEKCDAVDIGVASDTAVFPIFGGKVKDVSSDGLDAKKVIITSTDGKYTALYAHIKNSVKVNNSTTPPTSTDLKVGDDLNITESIGIAASNNIQIEIYYTNGADNKCIVTNHADMIDHALTTKRHEDWGGYLWDRIVKTFGLK